MDEIDYLHPNAKKLKKNISFQNGYQNVQVHLENLISYQNITETKAIQLTHNIT